MIRTATATGIWISMPEWSDTAIILSVRPFGENKGVVNLLTAERGRHAGLVHGFDSRTKRHL